MTELSEIPICELIPHRGESILIDQVIAHDVDTTCVQLTIGKEACLRRPDGSVPSWLAVEYMAQCVAAHEGLLARAAGRSLSLGFLISVSKLRLEWPHFPSEKRFYVRVKKIRGGPRLGVISHRCEIYAGIDFENQSPVAEGRLTIALDRSGEARDTE